MALLWLLLHNKIKVSLSMEDVTTCTDQALPALGLLGQWTRFSQVLKKWREPPLSAECCLVRRGWRWWQWRWAWAHSLYGLLLLEVGLLGCDDNDDELERIPFMAFYSWKLAFLDVCNYTSGSSYAKYRSTYSGPTCQGGKSVFLYEYVDRLARLCDFLWPHNAFYSSMCRANIPEEGLGPVKSLLNYSKLCWLWVCKGMISLRDLLLHYNNCNMVPVRPCTALQAFSTTSAWTKTNWQS